MACTGWENGRETRPGAVNFVVKRGDKRISVTVSGGRGKAWPLSLWAGFGKHSGKGGLRYQPRRWSKTNSGTGVGDLAGREALLGAGHDDLVLGHVRSDVQRALWGLHDPNLQGLNFNWLGWTHTDVSLQLNWRSGWSEHTPLDSSSTLPVWVGEF